MKRINFYILMSLLIGVLSCTKEQILTYEGDHYVQFTTSNLDTTNFSFFFHPGKSEVSVALPVKLIGRLPDSDLNYRIVLDQSSSDPGNDIYALETNYTFRKGLQQDTAYLVFKNKPELASRAVKLVFKLESTDDLRVGQTNYATRAFKVSDLIAQPTWWDADMVRLYLGVYSEKKFRTFMAVTGEGDLTQFSEGERRILMLQFKYYLIEMKEKGNAVLMEDGSDMLSTMPLIG